MLREKRLFLFDIDGTLALGETLLEGSRELLAYIDSIGGRSYFITNNSTKSTADYVLKFRRWGYEIPENRFVTAGSAAISFLKENYSGKKIFLLSTRSFSSEAEKNGLLITDRFEDDTACAMIAYDSEFTYRKAEQICELLFSKPEIPLYATNPDLCCPVPFGFVPDCGAICGMIEAATGRKAEYIGKPNRILVDLCLADSGFSERETIVVGDRLYTDIACGINAGVDTCCLFTGEAKPEDLRDTQFPPTYAFDTPKTFLEAIVRETEK
ncbi:MAG: HAD-IIA family hydrolase [Clostridia bacterium]|nr:HAD-IIA family hydrolase [Clostridia bacterium]